MGVWGVPGGVSAFVAAVATSIDLALFALQSSATTQPNSNCFFCRFFYSHTMGNVHVSNYGAQKPANSNSSRNNSNSNNYGTIEDDNDCGDDDAEDCNDD